MTAPLRQPEPIVVPVALGSRAYDIVIGRGLLDDFSARQTGPLTGEQRQALAAPAARLGGIEREIAGLLAAKGGLDANRVMDLGIDTTSPTGRMIAEIVVAVAAFERRLLLERQKVGIAQAKAEGKYRGRAPTARRRFARPRSVEGPHTEEGPVRGTAFQSESRASAHDGCSGEDAAARQIHRLPFGLEEGLRKTGTGTESARVHRDVGGARLFR